MEKAFYCYAVCAVCAVMLPVVSCSRDDGSGESHEGQVRLSFEHSAYKAYREVIEIPDTNDFILEVTDAAGNMVYSGAYGDSPESLAVPPGSCTVRVRSADFTEPRFSAPQFGDEQCVSVPAEGIVNVSLVCRQTNSGIRLRISRDFLTAYPSGVLFLTSDDGRLMYAYMEKRIAYFNPGRVSLVLNDGGSEKTIMTRVLQAREILTVDVGVASSEEKENSMDITVDTSRIWKNDGCVIGGDETGGGGIEDAFTIARAKENIGAQDVWVAGYIVGGDLSKNSVSFSPPFSSETNIVISSRSSASSKASCMSVSLSSGKIRDALNLVSHPENLHRNVYIKGDIVEAYFGIPGIKNVSDFRLE